ncbi:MAG: adenosylcobinamide-GDP ribazoletransferase [Pseudomonadota bacterium]
MGFIGREIGHFFVGVMFLTRLPVPRGLQQLDGRLARSAQYFPLIGVLVGLITGGVFYAASQVLHGYLAAGLAILAGILVTGALHEDGLADCADGIWGGATRERALEIMRDSRVGTYGACALVATLCLRGMALFDVEPIEGLIMLIVAHAVSRAMIPPVLVSGRYARTRGLASSVAEGVSTTGAALALVLAFGVAMIAGPVAAIAGFAAAMVAAGVMLWVLVGKLGGYTGDGLGAIQQCAEVAVLITLSGLLG